MPHVSRLSIAALLLAGTVGLPGRAADYPVQPVPFTAVQLTGGLLHDRQQTNLKVTLPFALGQCESSHRIKNFDLAAETMRRRAAGETNFQNRPATSAPFDDSDVYKVLEGASYCLAVQPDPALAAQVEGIIARIAAAQEPDGYLYTWRTMHPDRPAHAWIHQERWLNDPGASHELYNLGHLYEAGVAHAQATGSRTLLDVCLKSAELVNRDLGDGDPRIAPGHQVIEMGLARLFRQTGGRRWIDLARVFLENRGHGGTYSQDHQPVVDQAEAVGHAVRANYLYAGMADVAALAGDPRYLAAITRLWDNVAGRKLHLTGGCGARAGGEAYGDDYELPHRCYNETCAAVAFLFWNHRMFLMTGDAKYMDVFERSLYNGVLSGVSLSGDRFFYPNPLEADAHTERSPWFGCACCPPNVLRLLAQLGGYVYAVRADQLFVNLYGQGTATAKIGGRSVKIEQETAYPWDGKVTVRVTPDQPAGFALGLRIPGWVQGRPLPTDLYSYDDPAPAAWTLAVNGAPVQAELAQGFALIRREWKAGDAVTLELPMPVRRVAGNGKIAATRGQVALERGPTVYALEGHDNDGAIFDAAIPPDAHFAAEHRAELLGGATVIKVTGAQRAVRDEAGLVTGKPAELVSIPYALWANRGPSPMGVWFARDVASARPPPRPTLASRAKLTVSFSRGGMDPSRANDQVVPRDARDTGQPNFDFWPKKGTAEWMQYTFAQPTPVRAVKVYWFDDTGTGECRLPASWRISWRDEAGTWQPVKNKEDYAARKAEAVRVGFEPVTARALRLDLQLPEGFSSGVYEWEIE